MSFPADWKPGGDVTIKDDPLGALKRKVIEGVGYGEEVFVMNREALVRPAAARNGWLPAPLEREDQEALFALADANTNIYPMLALMFAIPNGQYRQGQRMEPGLRPGVPDIFLPYSVWVEVYGYRRIYYGLFLELKRSDHSNDPDPDQVAWMQQLARAGYKCVVAYGLEEAWTAIVDYLEGR